MHSLDNDSTTVLKVTGVRGFELKTEVRTTREHGNLTAEHGGDQAMAALRIEVLEIRASSDTLTSSRQTKPPTYHFALRTPHSSRIS